MVEKAIAVPRSKFDDLKRHPLRDNMLIAENAELMYCDRDDNYHCLLIYDEEQGDGLLIESEGSAYARYAQYIPRAKEIVERHQAPEISLTNSEKKLLNLLSEIAERIANAVQHGYKDFTIDDVLQDLAEVKEKMSEVHSIKQNQPVSAIKLTVCEAAEQWLSAAKLRVKESSYANYENIVKKHILPVLGREMIMNLTTGKLNDFINLKLVSGRLKVRADFQPNQYVIL